MKYNLISGFFAASAASFSKLGFNFSDDNQLAAYPYRWVLQALAIALMLGSNALVLKYYVLAMHEHGASKATVYNFAVNYLASIALGGLVFGEAISLRLLLGVTFILAGTAVISKVEGKEKAD